MTPERSPLEQIVHECLEAEAQEPLTTPRKEVCDEIRCSHCGQLSLTDPCKWCLMEEESERD